VAIKCADLGHLAESRNVHRRWVDNLEREFYDQGDEEKRLCLDVTPLFDRSKPGVSKSQQAFFDAVALPMFSDFAAVFPAARPLHDLALANRRQWSPSNSASMDNSTRPPASLTPAPLTPASLTPASLTPDPLTPDPLTPDPSLSDPL
jgi:hypothetical protein